MQEDIPSNSNILNSSSSCNKGQMVILCKRFDEKTQKHLEVQGDCCMELLNMLLCAIWLIVVLCHRKTALLIMLFCYSV